MFSLSGIHPTNTSYAVIAIQLITALNRTRGTSIPPVNINQVASSDPLVFGEMRSEIDASVNREDCSLCATPKAPSGASEPAAEPEKTALSDGPKGEGREHSELGVLKTE
jgi:hypothetical protein